MNEHKDEEKLKSHNKFLKEEEKKDPVKKLEDLNDEITKIFNENTMKKDDLKKIECII